MTDKVLLDIIELCLSVDKKAEKAYYMMSDLTKNADLKDFWQKMAEQEKTHIDYWKRLEEFAGQTRLPDVFDEPYLIKEELSRIDAWVEILLKRIQEFSSDTDCFLLAYRIEFYLVHPAFRILFSLLKTVTGEKTPEDEYEQHIDALVEGLMKYGSKNLELEIIGDAIRRFWRENKELFIQSTIDVLTGVFNRRGFFSTVRLLGNLAQRNGLDVGIMIIDIDNFKKINDTFGHQTGDEVVKSVAEILKNRLRSSDIIGRYGGDEFIVFLAAADRLALSKIAEEFRARVENEYAHSFVITISIGVASSLINKDVTIEKSVERLIASADDALYKAKVARNKVVLA